jgi:WXG100 family type VII secretion target
MPERHRSGDTMPARMGATRHQESHAMHDGMTSATDFTVDLAQFQSAIATVQGQAQIIDSQCSDITHTLQAVQASWNTPAGHVFDVLAVACITEMTNLTDLLGEMIARMQATYHNYEDAEQTNYASLQ